MSTAAIFRLLLGLALFCQVLIDLGGYLGWYYSQFPEEVFSFSGYEELIPFDVGFPLYLLWMGIYYLSILFLFRSSRFATLLVVTTLLLSFVNSFTVGIWVATPHELLLGWLSWSAYIGACAMFFCAPTISGRVISD